MKTIKRLFEIKDLAKAQSNLEDDSDFAVNLAANLKSGNVKNLQALATKLGGEHAHYEGTHEPGHTIGVDGEHERLLEHLEKQGFVQYSHSHDQDGCDAYYNIEHHHKHNPKLVADFMSSINHMSGETSAHVRYSFKK